MASGGLYLLDIPDDPAPAVDDVLHALDAVIRRCRDGANPAGYFAVMYHQVTAKVKEGIASGFFDDGPRMERLDAGFAARYLAALEAFEAGGRPTWSWEVTFRAARSARPIVLQHLLVAVNAHINLDLGIATAATAPGAALPSLRRDFDRINEILALVLEHVQRAIAGISPWIGLLDRIGGCHDDEVIRFSVEAARAGAWRFATELAPLDPDASGGPVRSRDARVARVAGTVLEPGWPLAPGLVVIHAAESGDVRRNLDALAAAGAPALSTVKARVRDPRAAAPEV